jgi:hypothetical protein
MGLPLLVVTALLPVSHPPDRAEWAVLLRVGRGQELVYRGTYRELSPRKAVRDRRCYVLESRAFVLDASPRGLDVAFLTVLRPNGAGSPSGQQAEAVSVRLERATVNSRGQVQSPNGFRLAPPVDSPPFIECGMFVEVPQRPLRPNEMWQTPEEGRPPVSWQAAGLEMLDEFPCLRLDGTQRTQGWDLLGREPIAWRRRETVWLSTDLGVARRVERIIERRLPAYGQPEVRLVSYDRQSVTQYPGQLFEDRRGEIVEAETLATRVAPCLSDPGRYGPDIYDGMLARINQHLERHPATPYREAILQVKHRIEAARRGETSPTLWP